MRPLRTFVAVELGAEVCGHAQKLIHELKAIEPDVRWVNPQQMHLTLVFLGDVEAERIAQVCRQVQLATGPFDPFEARFVGVGAFPDVERPRTIWLGLDQGREPLVLLQQAVEEQLAQLGFRPENRRYVPHVTLGRLRRPPGPKSTLPQALLARRERPAGTMLVDEATIFSSQLLPSGPEYESLGHAELRGRAADQR